MAAADPFAGRETVVLGLALPSTLGETRSAPEPRSMLRSEAFRGKLDCGGAGSSAFSSRTATAVGRCRSGFALPH